MRRRVAIAGLIAVGTIVVPASARAQQKPTSQTFEYSAYEKGTIARALEATQSKLDLAPEGKTIEGVETLRLEVFEDRDPVPEKAAGIPVRKLVNSLHVTSLDSIIRREMLLKDGDRYQQIIIEDRKSVV